MKAAELRPLEGADLVRRDSDLRQELFNLRFQFATRQLTNTARFRQVRRDIARIETIMRERELEAEPENG
ncbi:MAG TPA: 50S ribosomal protein L29 [Chloroflexota bacterium]|jgi:large subunit ribosomal protein L29